MKISAIVAALLLPVVLLAAPTTKPTTRDALSASLADATRDLKLLENKISDRVKDAGLEFDTTARAKDQISRISALNEALIKARATGTQQQKLDASSEWNKSRLKYESERNAAIESDTALNSLKDQRAVLKNKISILNAEYSLLISQTSVISPTPPPSPADLIGKTVPEVSDIFDRVPVSSINAMQSEAKSMIVLTREVDSRQYYKSWIYPVGGGARIYEITVLNGKVESVDIQLSH